MFNELNEINLDTYEPRLKRVFFPEQELIKRPAQLLQKHGFLPKEPGPVDIERFAEEICDFSYSTTLPEDLDGVTRFSLIGLPAVAVADRLAQDCAARPYLHFTIAHECGHVAFHNECFRLAYQEAQKNQQPYLLADSFACRNISHGGYCWYEWQANRAAAAFLMPYMHVIQVFSAMLSRLPGIQYSSIPELMRFLPTMFACELQATFQVSSAMASIEAEQFFKRNKTAIETRLERRGAVPF